MKVTLDEMKTLVSVVDSGSISSAAERLGLTVSATSRTLARLEEKLATTLINRTTRKLSVTEEGKSYLDKVRDIIQRIEEAEASLTFQNTQPTGLLRVDAASPVMLHIITPLLKKYQIQYPDVCLELTSNDGLIDLLEERIDIAIRIGHLKDSSLHARKIASSPIRLLASPSYLAVHGVPQTVEDLEHHHLLGFTQPEHLNRWPILDSTGERYLIDPIIRTSSGEILRQLALQGAGIVCLSDFMTAKDRQEGTLVPLLSHDTLTDLQQIHAVYYRHSGLSARIRTFIDFIASEIQTLRFYSSSHHDR